jgi:hypothetical protein
VASYGVFGIDPVRQLLESLAGILPHQRGSLA